MRQRGSHAEFEDGNTLLRSNMLPMTSDDLCLRAVFVCVCVSVCAVRDPVGL